MTTARVRLTKGFRVLPAEIPNKGIRFVDHQKYGRSGHGGNCLTECHNGDIVAFYSNVSGEIYNGHGVAGWSEYRRSKEGGVTWSEPVVLDIPNAPGKATRCIPPSYSPPLPHPTAR